MLQTVCIRITQHCNLSCSHCRSGSSPRTKRYLDVNTYMKALLSLKELGLKHVSISGGEPLLVQNLGEVVRSLVDYEFYISITTNGTLCTSQFISQLDEKRLDKVKIRVSIDGDRLAHEGIRGDGTFDRTLLELRHIKRNAGWVGINTVIDTNVKYKYQELFDSIAGLSINEWCLITPVAKGSNSEFVINHELILDRIHEFELEIQRLSNIERVTIWDFISTPNTSLLIDTDGILKLTGIYEGTDLNIGDIYNLDNSQIKEEIERVKLLEPLSHFEFNADQWK